MQVAMILARAEKTVIVPFAVLCFLAWLYLTTPYGVGISIDSAAYLKAAQGLAQGRSIELFSSQWPPLYPFLIGTFGTLFNSDIITGARVLQALLFSINFLLTYLILSRASALNPLITLSLSTLLNLHWTGVYVHYYAWSEPLYICFILLDLLLLQRLFNPKNNTSKSNSLLLAGLMLIATLAVYTRYIGLSVAITNAFLVCTIAAVSWQKRVFHALIQILVPLLLIIPWLRYRSASQDANTEPGYAFQGPSIDKLIAGTENIGRWLLPGNYPADQDGGNTISFCIGLGLLLFGFAVLIQILSKQLRKNAENSLSPIQTQLLINYSFVYIYLGSLLFFLFSIIMTMKLENRYLAPAFIPFTIGLILFCSALKKPYLRWGLLALLAIAMSLSYPQLRTRALLSYFNGIELNARSVLAKPLNVFINSCPQTAQAAADNPWHFELWFKDKVRWLPRHAYYGSHKPNPNFYEEVASLSQTTDLIVVEDMSSEIVSLIDKNPDFTRIYAADGIVWRNRTRNQVVCRAQPESNSGRNGPSN
jgi:hypothetical protein